MGPKNYWKNQHQKYSNFDWIDKPTIFAQTAIKYFPQNSKILELGCGHGQDSRYLSTFGHMIEATDFSDKALEYAKNKTNKNNDNINYNKVDLRNPLPYRGSEFDVVYSHLALHYFDKQKTTDIFKEISRVLRPEGILAILLNTVEDPETNEGHIEIEKDLYEVNGLVKRYFSTQTLESFVSKDFEFLLLDNRGETHKDKIGTLIRFIGKKKNL